MSKLQNNVWFTLPGWRHTDVLIHENNSVEYALFEVGVQFYYTKMSGWEEPMEKH